jgi:hypothetical protein
LQFVQSDCQQFNELLSQQVDPYLSGSKRREKQLVRDIPSGILVTGAAIASLDSGSFKAMPSCISRAIPNHV